MYEFTLGMAGLKIGVAANFAWTRDMCENYITEGPADFCVSVGLEDLAWEKRKAKQDSEKEGLPPEKVLLPVLEHAALYRMIANRVLEHDILLFHGSAIAVDGEAYLFTALSGTGKSTHTRLWREHFGDRAVMVNDDKPLLKVSKGQVLVCGTPWNGKHRLGENIMVPLKAICVLNRGEENTIRPLMPLEAFPHLLQQTYNPGNAAGTAKVLSLLTTLTECTGLYSLHCNMDPQAAVVAYEGMNRKDA